MLILLVDPKFLLSGWLSERSELNKKIEQIDSQIWDLDERELLDINLYQRSKYNRLDELFWFAKVKISESILFGKEQGIEKKDKLLTLNLKIGSIQEFEALTKKDILEIAYEKAKEKIMNIRIYGVPRFPTNSILVDSNKENSQSPNQNGPTTVPKTKL